MEEEVVRREHLFCFIWKLRLFQFVWFKTFDDFVWIFFIHSRKFLD